MLIGMAAEGGFAGFTASEDRLSRDLAVRRSYDSVALPATYDASGCAKDWPLAKAWSAYSFAGLTPKTTAEATTLTTYLTSLANGNEKTKIRAWMRSVPAQTRVYFGAMHEVNAKVNKGWYSRSLASDAMNAVWDAISTARTAGETRAIKNIVFTGCLTADAWNSGDMGKGLYDTFTANCEVVAADPYGRGKYNATNLQDDFYDWCDLKNKTAAIWEFSTAQTQPGGRAAWLTEFFDYAFKRGADHVIGYNSSINDADPIIGDDASRDAYVKAIDLYGTAAYDLTQVGPPPPPPPPRPVKFDRGMGGTYTLTRWGT